MKNLVLFGVLSFMLMTGTVNVESQTLTNYVKQKKAELVERQRVEKERYDDACEAKTLTAYQSYLEKYPKGKYVSEINDRIAEYYLWNNAKRANTIDAYNNYIRDSKFQYYQVEAKDAIAEIQSNDAWQKVKDSHNVGDFENFVQEFPNSSFSNTAKMRMHELKAVEYYNAGDYANAYSEFGNAGGGYAIDASNKGYYDKCVEYHEFSKLSNSSDESDLLSFLGKYPNSEHYDTVSDMIAVLKAKKFTMYAGEGTFNEALYYAKDKATRDVVMAHIDGSKRAYAIYQQQQRAEVRRNNGGTVNFGLELLDFGKNAAFSNRIYNFMYYNVGVSVRLGNYKDFAQLEIGVKLGVYEYDLKDKGGNNDYFDSDDEYYKFHMPVFARLKINLFSMGSSKCYISGMALYNAVKVKDIESNASWQAGIGAAWRHWDWTILYYRQDINSEYSKNGYDDDKMLGCSLTYYF